MSRCPKCNLEMFCENGGIVFENDDTPEKNTKAYQIVNEYCRNEKCENYWGGNTEKKVNSLSIEIN